MMKRTILPICLAGVAGLSTAHAAEPQNGSGETGGYRLVWQDLFDDGELRADRWNIEVNGGGGGNAELQYYSDREENVRVGDDGEGNGCLILTARREEYRNRHFTSGRVNTKKRVSFTHGKIEASIKIPQTADGLWPAFWMMGNDYDEVGWPRCGETDILEMGHQKGIQNGTTDRFFNGACHWGQGWPNASYAQETTKTYSLQDGQFHLFTLVWDEERMMMFVDLDKKASQTPYYHIDIRQDNPEDEWAAGNYFHKENFILFNLAVGGNFPGIHDAGDITALNEANGQKASMYVNYVKVYQKGSESETLTCAAPGDGIEGTGVEILADDGPSDDALRIESGRIVAPRCEVEVFNLAGCRVAAGDDFIEISNIIPGMYVATARDTKTNKKTTLKFSI